VNSAYKMFNPEPIRPLVPERLCQVSNVSCGSIVSLNVTPLARQLSGVEQTETDESGPSPADLPLSGE
jgi:hypothetical protein